ncbi:sensor histidine kinase [Kordia algicida OT-1]|uniref:histidine kinase n=1 Tax=Kordia algicida OT-1 TaxID=391587 RepID=A9ECT8_9FLAO|nr:sensor histidine kinase [Kordia algicida]EDP94311.1 signal transduction histidine kinase [Kordia algicida OT-1]
MKFRSILIIFALFLFLSLNAQKKTDSTAISLSNKAWSLYYKQNDSALYYADKGLEYAQKNNSTIGKILNLEIKGVYYEEVKNDFKTASELYFQAIEIAEKNHLNKLSSLYNNLCIMYMVNDYEKSEFYGKKAVETSEYSSKTTDAKSALVNLGIAQSLLKKYEEAQENFDKYFQYKDESDYHKNIVYLRIAKNLKEQGLYQKAQPLFLKIIALDSMKGQREYAQDYIQLIENTLQLQQKDTLQKYVPVLSKSMESEKNLQVKEGYYDIMVRVYAFFDETEKILEYQSKLLNIKDSISSNFYDKSVAELETKYQTKKKEEQILAEKSKRQLWIFISTIAFIIAILILVLLIKNQKKRKLLNQNKIELEKLLNQRNMLLKETHHRVKNSFQMVSSLLQLQASGSKAETAVSALNNAVQRVNSMIVLHQQLYARDNLLGVDLKLYIEELINEILRSYTSQDIQVQSSIESYVLDVNTATSIGLLVNELATNSIKYAWNDEVLEKIIHLKIIAQDEKLYFEMYDNGKSKVETPIQKNYGSQLIEILIDRLRAKKHSINQNSFAVAISFNPK